MRWWYVRIRSLSDIGRLGEDGNATQRFRGSERKSPRKHRATGKGRGPLNATAQTACQYFWGGELLFERYKRRHRVANTCPAGGGGGQGPLDLLHREP